MDKKTKTKAKMNTKNSNARMKRPSNPERGSMGNLGRSKKSWISTLIKRHPYWIGAILLLLLILLIILIIIYVIPLLLTDDKMGCLYAHNKYRAKHGVPPMKISLDLVQIAQIRANKLAKLHDLIHSPGNDIGENLYMMKGAYSTCAQATTYWYEEFSHFGYNFKDPIYVSETGHATQIIWASSNQLGCAASNTTIPLEQYIVCLYRPPGNVINQFKENVLPPRY